MPTIGLRSASRPFLRKFSATIKCLVIVAHLFGITRKKDNLVKMPGYQAELMCKLLCAIRMPYWERLEERLHATSANARISAIYNAQVAKKRAK